MSVSLRITQELMDELHTHLFPGDGDEHGAVIAASVVETERGTRLLAHRLFKARDGVDYVPGDLGYRMLTNDFVMECVLECAELKMAYLAVHCHGGMDEVEFSSTDMSSHERGYPALRDILDGPPAGGLVFSENAVAGDIWFANGNRQALDVMVVVGNQIRELRPKPQHKKYSYQGMYDRQSRLFGDAGQALLVRQKIGVIGAGGVGSIVIEQLARLGVGKIVVIDPERLEESNLSRIVGSKQKDTKLWSSRLLVKIRHNLAKAKYKVDIAKRHAKEARPELDIETYIKTEMEPTVAATLLDCDYLFLAADSMQSRLVYNAIAHQYLIPGAQMGVKIQVNKESGIVIDSFVAYRPLVPGRGCLWCNGLILSDKLQEEGTQPEQLKRQRYVDGDDIPAPSVITLNAITASLATNGYLMAITGLSETTKLEWIKYYPRTNEYFFEQLRKDDDCLQCSLTRLGRGPTVRLPTYYRPQD